MNFENLTTKKEDKKIEGKDKNMEEEVKPEYPENGEIIAIISAAIAAYLEISPSVFCIRTIKRIPTLTPIWGMLGRQEQVYSRL